jgi:hypothetical protein
VAAALPGMNFENAGGAEVRNLFSRFQNMFLIGLVIQTITMVGLWLIGLRSILAGRADLGRRDSTKLDTEYGVYRMKDQPSPKSQALPEKAGSVLNRKEGLDERGEKEDSTVQSKKQIKEDVVLPLDLNPVRRLLDGLAAEMAHVAATDESPSGQLSSVIAEIRNLADQAAEATRRTNQMIECSLKAVKTGDQLTKTVKVLLEENRLIAGKVKDVMDEMTLAFQKHSGGLH